MTVLGLSSYGVAWSIGVSGFEQPAQPLDSFGLVALAAQLGLRLVQIADNLPLSALSSSERARLRAEAALNGVHIEIGTRGIASAHLTQYVELAAEFGSPILRVVVDTAMHHPAPDEVVTAVRALLPVLRAHHVTLAIENHDRFKARTLAQVIETIDDPLVGICLDTVNSFGALEGPECVVTTLAQYVVNLHIKEFVIQRLPHQMGFEVTGAPVGQGMLDVPWLLAALRQHNRPFNALIEIWSLPLKTMRATIAREQDWLNQSVAYLRTLIAD